MRAEQLVLAPAGRQAIKSLRDAKPWRGTFGERKEKFETFAAEFADATGMTVKFEFVGKERRTKPGNGGYDSTANRIVLIGKLSVITALFCFGSAGGLKRAEALKWARDLFAHFFPRSFARCQTVNGLTSVVG